MIEVLSPGEETLQKLPFYAKHDVDEVLIVNPQRRAMTGVLSTRALAHTTRPSAAP